VACRLSLLLTWALAMSSCGGGETGGSGATTPQGHPTGEGSDAPQPSHRDDTPAAATVRELLGELATAMENRDVAALRGLADPETGTWFWADPGTVSVPCTWMEAMGEEDPFDPDSQQCSPDYLLRFYTDVLRAAVPVASVDGPRDIPAGASPWGSIDTEPDLAWLRIAAEEAGASSRVQRTIGEPLRHAFRGVLGDRAVTVYFSERVGALFISHVIAWRIPR